MTPTATQKKPLWWIVAAALALYIPIAYAIYDSNYRDDTSLISIVVEQPDHKEYLAPFMRYDSNNRISGTVVTTDLAKMPPEVILVTTSGDTITVRLTGMPQDHMTRIRNGDRVSFEGEKISGTLFEAEVVRPTVVCVSRNPAPSIWIQALRKARSWVKDDEGRCMIP